MYKRSLFQYLKLPLDSNSASVDILLLPTLNKEENDMVNYRFEIIDEQQFISDMDALGITPQKVAPMTYTVPATDATTAYGLQNMVSHYSTAQNICELASMMI